MDIFNFARAVEQGIYDVMLWIFFFPYTLVRMVIQPAAMLRHVAEETSKDPAIAFESAMRPALFLFIAIAFGTLIAPLNVGQVKVLQQSQIGQLVASSWFALMLVRMIVFCMFPLIGAVIFDLLTPGRITRTSLRAPFYQQCYISAPFALVISPTLVNLGRDSAAVLALAVATTAWFLAVQVIFFRRFAGKSWLQAMLLAPAVLFLGWLGITVISVLAFG